MPEQTDVEERKAFSEYFKKYFSQFSPEIQEIVKSHEEWYYEQYKKMIRGEVFW
jgi:hypothetical protein